MDLLPRPTTFRPHPGSAVLTEAATLSGPAEWTATVRRLLSPGTGFTLPDVPAPSDGTISVRRGDDLHEEGYRLEVAPDGITITAATTAGVNWATQTLRQLVGPDVLRAAPVRDRFELACVVVEDAPRFAWRGAMLDVARHFAPLSELFRFVDLLALHKLNVFHLHLTDDQGWRFASARHPRLQEVGGWRTETQRHLQPTGDGTPHGGSYTADQLRALVRYAADRGVTVVPELEFPGHVRALLAAYPELGHHVASPRGTATTFGVFDDVLDLADDTLAFVLDVYDELLEVFPSAYVHVGGDEVPRTEWLASTRAAELAGERGLSGPALLQRWFTERLRDWLADRSRRLVGWDEINDEGPLEGAVAMAWRDVAYGIAAARAGMDVVMTPTSHTYLDYYPSDDPDEAYAIGGLVTTEQVYGFDPLAGIPPELHPRVLGTQAQLWREYAPTVSRTDYLLFPRACALSEVAWSDPSERAWSEFVPRLEAHLGRLDAVGVQFRPTAGPHPWQRGGTGATARPRAHRSASAAPATPEDV